MNNLQERLSKVGDKLQSLQKFQDVEGFIRDLEHQVNQMEFFYNTLTPRATGDPTTTFYIPKKVPQVHQIAYFNLTRGFPKELHGGHWCYIYKVIMNKILIIPTTSVKEDSILKSEGHLDIEVNNFNNQYITRLQLGDMRVVDVQRIYPNKGYYDVISDRDYIVNAMEKLLINYEY